MVRTVGTQVEMVKTVTGAEVRTPAEVAAVVAVVVGTTTALVVQLVEVFA